MNLGTPPDPIARLALYLNDHRAAIVGEIALAERCRESNIGTGLGHDLTLHVGAVDSDRIALDQLIRSCGGSIDHVKSTGAAIAERIGRLKPNGQLWGYSPLSRIVELEGLVTATTMRSLMWQTCTNLDLPVGDELAASFSERRESTDAQQRMLIEYLEPAKVEAFGDPTP